MRVDVTEMSTFDVQSIYTCIYKYMYIPEKRKFSGILYFRQCRCRSRRRVRRDFVVSVITFERFKLRSSNLTHALLIQISRTSSIIDIVVPSKMATGGHFVKNERKKVLHRSEMARTYKMAAGCHFVKNVRKK